MNITNLDFKLTLELSSRDVNADRSDEVLKGINILIEKTDEIILRDLRSANKGLMDIIATKAYSSAILTDIKTFYRKNTGLTPAGHTGGRLNTEIITYSYMGLYVIGLIEHENEQIMLRYVFRMFETGQQIVRDQWFPNVYRDIFKPHCRDVEVKYEHRLRNRAGARDYAKASGIRATQGVILLASLLGNAIARNNQPAWRVRELENEIPKKEFFTTEHGLRLEQEREINRRCAEIAKTILENWD